MSTATLARLAGTAVQLLGSSPVHRVVRRALGERLRVLAYHGIDDPLRFDAQMAELRRHYRPVSASDVICALDGKAALPDRAVWVTFDDADPGVVRAGAPVLARHDISATLFVCPGLVDTEEPFWWDVVAAATEQGVSGLTTAQLLTELKQADDADRRSRVADLQRALEERGNRSWHGSQVTSQQLISWLNAGHSIGNHSWDHPCLDRCTPENARHQVRDADDWIRRFDPHAPRLFAYPNGNWSPAVEAELVELGYAVGLLFDHQLASSASPDRMRLSRLRIDAAADIHRFRAVVSGAHSTAFHLARSLRSGRARS